jgi:outer membrane protein assembly factor BamB
MGSATTSEATSTNGTEVIGIQPNGQVAWRITPFGLGKGAIPFVSQEGLLYLPVVGPHNNTGSEPYIGLDVVTTQGAVLKHLPTAFAPALSPNGNILDANAGRLTASNLSGVVLWTRKLPSSRTVGPIVGQDGKVYVSANKILYAYTSSGTVLWTKKIVDQALAIAQRADGVLLVASRTRLRAVGVRGKQLWGVLVGKTPGQYAKPSVIVDATGTSYVGSGDGIVRIISLQGRILARLQVGGVKPNAVPTALLGADGKLFVNGTDGVLRVYDA